MITQEDLNSIVQQLEPIVYKSVVTALKEGFKENMKPVILEFNVLKNTINPRMLTMQQAADVVKKSYHIIRTNVLTGSLPANKTSKSYYILYDDLIKWNNNTKQI
jgi:hypothetical protein